MAKHHHEVDVSGCARRRKVNCSQNQKQRSVTWTDNCGFRLGDSRLLSSTHTGAADVLPLAYGAGTSLPLGFRLNFSPVFEERQRRHVCILHEGVDRHYSVSRVRIVVMA
jgi:hypothetical protein